MTSKVLFVCIHNSARSQMAEAFLTQRCAHRFEVHSAGIEPGRLNPMVVVAMLERGIDISKKSTKSVFALLTDGLVFDYVITVCDETSAERCPVFPGVTARLHWGFPDPSALQGSYEERLQGTRVIRDQIEQQVADWCVTVCPPHPSLR
jgi:arsenate reductase